MGDCRFSIDGKERRAMDQEALSLTNLGNGGLVEVFDRELQEVLRNIADPNSHAEKKRRISVEVVFKPYEDRSGSDVEFSCKATLCGFPAVKTRMFITKSGSNLKAFSVDPRQISLFVEPVEGRAQ